MSGPFNTGNVVGGLLGTAVGGVPGGLAGSALGGLIEEAYKRKPVVGNFATTLQNDLAPESVTLDAHQIYKRITEGRGAGTLVEADAAAKTLSTRFAERANQIAAARGAAAAAWQGDASTSAAAATAPLADSFAVAQQQLATNSQALTAEATAFHHIRSQVEFVPETPPQSGILNAANPFQTDVDAAINEYNAKAAKNVQLYEAYSADTASARSQVPQSYAAPPPLSASAAATTLTASPIGAAPAAPPQVTPAADAGQPAATNASAAPGGAASAPPSTGSASGTPSGTAGQGAATTDPASRPTPQTTTPSALTPTLPATRDTSAGVPLPSHARPAGLSDLQRKSTGAGSGIGGSGSVGAFGGGPGARGTGPEAGTGMRGGPSVGTGPVPGQTPAGRSGVVPGPAPRGAAGMGGMPVAPGGRSNGEEDQEHRRKYLIQPDSDELFGTDEPYIRPVIGDNR
jgi:hypothetical protein